jgi:hypothetical protein
VVDLIADLKAVGELVIVPEGGPHGEQAYRIPGCEIVSQGMKSSGEIFDTQGVKPFHIESVNESYFENPTEDEETWLTPDDAVKLGLTRGSRLYRKAIGELLPEE